MLRMAGMHPDLPSEAKGYHNVRREDLHHMQGTHDLPWEHRGVHQSRLSRKEEDLEVEEDRGQEGEGDSGTRDPCRMILPGNPPDIF